MSVALCPAAAANGDVEYLRGAIKQSMKSRGPAGLPAVLSETDANGFSLLHVACQAGHTECVALLLAFGARVTASKSDGITPLHAACSGGHPASWLPICESLLEARADACGTTQAGETALHTLLQGASEQRHRALSEQTGNVSTHPEAVDPAL